MRQRRRRLKREAKVARGIEYKENMVVAEAVLACFKKSGEGPLERQRYMLAQWMQDAMDKSTFDTFFPGMKDEAQIKAQKKAAAATARKKSLQSAARQKARHPAFAGRRTKTPPGAF